MQSAGCILWNVDPVIFELGPVTYRWYGLLFAMVFVVGYHLLRWQFVRAGYDEREVWNLVIWMLVSTIIGGYLGHRIFYEWDRFVADPLSTFTFKGGIRGMASHGSGIAILTMVYFYKRRTGLRYIEVADRLTFGTSLATIFVRLGNLMNSEIVGRQTDVPWAFCFPRFESNAVPRHPSQIYEALGGCVLLLILLFVDKKAGGEKRPLGLMFGTFMAVYFTGRFLVEFFKEYQAMNEPQPLTMGQVLSIPAILFGIGMIVWARNRRLPANQPMKTQKAKA